MKLIRTFALIAAIVFAGSSLSQAAAPASLRETIDQKTQDLQKLNERIKAVEAELKTATTQKVSLQRELKQLNSSLAALNLSIEASAITIDKLTLEKQSLDYDIKDAQTKIERKQEGIVKLLRELWDKRSSGIFILILRHRTLAQSFLEQESIANINVALAAEAKDLRALQADLTNKLKIASDKKRQTEIERTNLANKRLIVLDTKSSRENLLTKTKSQESIYQQEITELRKQQDAINDEIAALETELRKTFDPTLLPAKRPGVLGTPLANIIRTQDYGKTAFARTHYKTQSHNGVDFAASIGTPIFAVSDGRVSGAGNNGRLQYGRYVMIEHDNNLSTLYAHLSRTIVANGDIVQQGQVIGYSGNTGYAFGPHLHLGVYWTPSVTFKPFPGAGLVPVGITIDPNDYL